MIRRKHVAFRRKREQKTDYKKRLSLVKSGLLRLVVRKSLNNLNLQIVEYNPKGDKVLVCANSRELIKLGYKGNRGNLPAAYLLGLLLAKKAKNAKIKKAIFDIGLYAKVKGNLLFAALKGAVDNGLDVAHNEDIFPSEERLSGEHIANYAKHLESNKEKYDKQFSVYLKQGLKPQDLKKHVEEIKAKIIKE
ncbi:MAG: 50S ribosomal protein L18 [archaeon]